MQIKVFCLYMRERENSEKLNVCFLRFFSLETNGLHEVTSKNEIHNFYLLRKSRLI